MAGEGCHAAAAIAWPSLLSIKTTHPEHAADMMSL
jgi:hypothetical protein